MLLAEVAATSDAVAATRSRLAKRAAIADLLRRVADDAEAGSAEVEIAVAYLAGELRQRRTGLGWRSLRDLPAPAEEPGLTLTDVDAAFARMADLSGPGSSTARQAEAATLFGAATAREQSLLAGLVSGELRQGALDSVVVDAVAEAAGVPADAVRRAVMLAGATGPVARAALTAGGPEAATEALATFRLTVGRPVRPMLAQSAPDVGAALDKLGAAPGGEDASGTAVAVDVKLDGIRIQVHRDGDDVRVFTRSLDDITERVPEIVAAVRALPGRALVLDGEALVVGPDGVPRPFQETAARSATQGERSAAEEAELAASLELSPFFFDVLHADGRDLLDEPLRDRLAVLDDLLADLLADAAGPLAVRRLVTDDAAAATAFFDAAVAEGQEGVVVKSLDAPYAAGRRGAGWVKVKPRHTLDLVVLAVERGSGRRSGWLSNIWLGARDPEGGFVMLGKTFKGMTDEMLAWQTQRFRELQTADEGYVVHVRPEQVVEIAFDGLQRSTRYPGGLALRFARVVRYRDDKTAAEADTIDTVRALARPLGGGAAEAPDAEG
ncbi:ATP-dependent DNA ligase [Cellulosimicrobium sp. XJ-DQ-B-000]|uniref:ATP-dependent DNA ligase n=1 Tax=Cellulosimicrobium sp. XJ-DQ-B-000 TaxID=3072182 RepID=UPI002808B0A0|nr:ATP-dependent DNA ligase [Cellulosimicrobium sp. XJ-DQ-B-000]MDQ8041873.1 ATP-dependent DNA ligase [Cellulosimicrobium sp. XJ-DQ-B-000]